MARHSRKQDCIHHPRQLRPGAAFRNLPRWTQTGQADSADTSLSLCPPACYNSTTTLHPRAPPPHLTHAHTRSRQRACRLARRLDVSLSIKHSIAVACGPFGDIALSLSLSSERALNLQSTQRMHAVTKPRLHARIATSPNPARIPERKAGIQRLAPPNRTARCCTRRRKSAWSCHRFHNINSTTIPAPDNARSIQFRVRCRFTRMSQSRSGHFAAVNLTRVRVRGGTSVSEYRSARKPGRALTLRCSHCSSASKPVAKNCGQSSTRFVYVGLPVQAQAAKAPSNTHTPVALNRTRNPGATRTRACRSARSSTEPSCFCLHAG